MSKMSELATTLDDLTRVVKAVMLLALLSAVDCAVSAAFFASAIPAFTSSGAGLQSVGLSPNSNLGLDNVTLPPVTLWI